MTLRFPRRAAALVLASITLAACSSDDTSPVEVSTVRLAIVPGAHHGGAPLATDMTTEIRHTPVEYTGDPDGTGTALITLNIGQGEVCWHLTVEDIDLPATLAHIHEAAPGAQGPPVVNLTAPDASGESAGCASADKALVKRILQSPELFYVNVHTAGLYASGAVRGQLD